ncbi:hypothetical protein QO259_10115 [Salinicola sp. JS01]|uniref:hypothetical protein n=1 Tax=Salinicola sp. JS01 TaxID=3050071 RepID=UPI00255B6608|nr:hypothetical protein [Salinicola sp. JS01]WIX31194.1 hypothetical protein QO259_10115 [Salinicola sp. JS01]
MTDYRLSLVLDNIHDRASLTATSERPGAPVDYTQRNERNRVWRSTGTSTQVIEGTLGAGTYADTVAIIGHNLTSAGTLRIEWLNGSSIIRDSGEIATGEIIPAGVWRAGIDPYQATYNDRLQVPGRLVTFEPAPITGYRITLDDPSNPAGALQVARIVTGLAFRPAFNMSYGVQTTWVDPATHERSAGQTLRTIGGGNPRRRVQFALDWLLPGDRERLIEEIAEIGMIRDVYVDLYPDRTGIERLSGQFVGRLTEGYGDTHDHYRNYTSTITITEV